MKNALEKTHIHFERENQHVFVVGVQYLMRNPPVRRVKNEKSCLFSKHNFDPRFSSNLSFQLNALKNFKKSRALARINKCK